MEARCGSSDAVHPADDTLISIQAAKLASIPGARSNLQQIVCSQPWPFSQENICLVRGDYVRLVSDLLDGEPNQNLVLIGQSGTGKSFAGAYAAWSAIARGIAVIWATLAGVYILDPAKGVGLWYLSCKGYPGWVLHRYADAVLIHDCQERMAGPPTSKRSRTLVIAAPEDVSRYSTWKNQTGPKEVFLDVWTDDELEDMATALSIDRAAMRLRCAEFGPIPRYVGSANGESYQRQEFIDCVFRLRYCDDFLGALLEQPTNYCHHSYSLMLMTTRVRPGHYLPYMLVPANPKLLLDFYKACNVVVRRRDNHWIRLMEDCCDQKLARFENLYAPLLLHGKELGRLLREVTALGSAPRVPLPVLPTGCIQGVELSQGAPAVTLNDITFYWTTDNAFAVFDWFIKEGTHLVAFKFTVEATASPQLEDLWTMHRSFEAAFGEGTFGSISTWSIVYVQRRIDPQITTVQTVEGASFVPYYPNHLLCRDRFARELWNRFQQFQATPPLLA